MTSLNPLFTVEQQLKETIHANMKVTDEEAYQRALSSDAASGYPPTGKPPQAVSHTNSLVVCANVW